MRVEVLAVWIATMGMLLVGCSSSQGADAGCTITVLYGGQVYGAVQVQSTPRPGQSLGRADFGDCDGSPLVDRQDTGELFALPQTDIDRAVLLRQRGHDAVYVNEALSVRDRPRLVKAATGYPECDRPVRFTGTWSNVDAEDMPDEGDYDIAVPYTATFTATRGRGLDFDRWSSIELPVRITDDTDPVPGPRFLERALTSETPVTVTTTCRGIRFDVATIRFAD